MNPCAAHAPGHLILWIWYVFGQLFFLFFQVRNGVNSKLNGTSTYPQYIGAHLQELAYRGLLGTMLFWGFTLHPTALDSVLDKIPGIDVDVPLEGWVACIMGLGTDALLHVLAPIADAVLNKAGNVFGASINLHVEVPPPAKD